MQKTKTTKTNQGAFHYSRNDNSSEFECARCNQTKKSKITVKWITLDGEERLICNGCYGYLLSQK